ncbi:MAG: response regulator transcription factor [Bacteroidota bacterium]
MTEKASIFIVDDDIFIHQLLKYGLNDNNVLQCEHYFSGEECLNNIHKEPDIIVIDMEMSGMNGLETIAKIQQPDIRIFLMSAKSHPEIDQQAKEKGVEQFILKDNQLLNTLNSILSSLSSSKAPSI